MSWTDDQAGAPVLLLVHGWGLGAGVWQAVRRHLPGYTCLTPDLGFFAPPRELQLPEGRPIWAVGHSLGLLWLLQQLPQAPWRARCRALLGITAFSRFVRGDDFPEGVAPRLLQRMQQRLPIDPQAVLRDFARQGGSELAVPVHIADTAPLLQGLEWLATWDGRESLRQWQGTVANLAACDDQIVPQALSRRCFTPEQCQWLPQGGHLLPVTQPLACARFIQHFLPAGPHDVT
ncbi:MAG: alpha/beta hydrolase [Magnetococcales bacterium]|nr:alpha/beta hydrolase [Magnetococcales bacterium]MBF0116504.1 alpha/beta hydrolase [Magnetococcales bacterium]